MRCFYCDYRGFSTDIMPMNHGIAIKIHGFNDKLPVRLQCVNNVIGKFIEFSINRRCHE
jgi:hypothetical protein